MGIKQDWLERQIEEIGDTMAAVLFGVNKLKKTFEKFKENKNEDNTNGMDEMLMDALVDSYVKKGKLKEAEEILFSSAENQKTLHTLSASLLFYNKLLGLDDEKLASSGFSKEKIRQGIEKLKQIYE